MVEWGIAKEFSLDNLSVVHIPIVVICNFLEDLVQRIVGLNDYFADFVASSRAACNLSEHIKASFVSSEIGIEQHTVCIDHTDQANLVKIQSFAHKLCPAQYISLAFGEVFDDFCVGTLLSCGIEVQSCHFCIGKVLLGFGFNLFASASHHSEQMAVAFGTLVYYRRCITAVVAVENSRMLMHCQRYIAVGTACSPTANLTAEIGSKASQIFEKDYLSVFDKCSIYFLKQRFRKDRIHQALLHIVCQIHNLHLRKGTLSVAIV